MKKRNLLLALLSSSLILASCGGDKPADESAKGTETSQSDDSNAASQEPGQTQPDTSVDTRSNADKVKDLFAEMALGKSSTVEYNGYATEFYGDTKGIWNQVPASNTEATSSGIAVIPNYGIYQVGWDDGFKEYYLAGIVSPNKALKISDVQYTTIDLGEGAKTVTFTESSRTHTFSTDNAGFCDSLLGVLGAGSLAAVYGSKKVSFNINEDGSALTNMSLDLSAPTDAQYKATKVEGIKISKIGTTSDLDFEVLITNPGITARTAWTNYELQYFSVLHTNFTLPFPTGASYAVNVSATEKGEFMFEDLGCGNLVNSYKTQLTNAGFTLNEEKTDTQKGLYVYEKTLVPASGNVGAIKEIVKFAWLNDAAQATIYPNGQFMIVAYPIQEVVKMTVAQLTTELATHTFSDGTQYWPDFVLDNCTGAALDDQTSYMQAQQPDYAAEFYGIIRLYYETEAQAIAAVETIADQLTKNGYYHDSYYDIYYISAGDYYTPEEVDITVKVVYDDNGNYSGYVQVIIDSYSYDNY